MMWTFLLLFGAVIALYVNVAASAGYASLVMDAGPGGGWALAVLFTIVEFLVPLARRDERLRQALVGREEDPASLRGMVVPALAEGLLYFARLADIFTTAAGLSGWDPSLSPGANLRAMVGSGSPTDLLILAVRALAAVFYALGPEEALLLLFEEGLAHEGLAALGGLLRFLRGLRDGIAQIPVRARLVATGQKRPSRPRPGPVTVGVIAAGIPAFAAVEAFNLYTTTAAARMALVPFAGELGFWGLAALIAGFQGVLWSRQRDRAGMAWMASSLAVDYATAWLFFAGAHPEDPAALLFGAGAALFVVFPEPVLGGLIRAAAGMSRGEVTAAVAAVGDFLGSLLGALREARREEPAAGRRPAAEAERARGALPEGGARIPTAGAARSAAEGAEQPSIWRALQ